MVITASKVSAVVESWLPRHRFSVSEFHRMRELGVLAAQDQFELLDGLIIARVGRAPRVILPARESKAMDAVPDSWIPFHRFTVDEYYRMAEIGLFASNARIELIEGEIIDMAPTGSWHCGAVDWITALFFGALPQRANIRTQGALRLSAFSEPEPDIALLKRRGDFYRDNHPGPSETLLVVEVSDSSLQTDQMVKVPLFAHFGIPEVWIVDGAHERLHVYRSPKSGQYTDVSSMERPGTLALSALPDVTVDLSGLFG